MIGQEGSGDSCENQVTKVNLFSDSQFNVTVALHHCNVMQRNFTF